MKPASKKLRVYETLHALNHGFEQVLTELGRLGKLGFRREVLAEFRVVVEETRAWANFELVETMHDREERDWVRFGRLRHQWEKKLFDPNDVLIEAARRKEELRKVAEKRAARGKRRKIRKRGE
jgi:hypothetical protein